MFSVAFRPAAFGTSSSKPLQPRGVVVRPLLTIDPAKTERLIEGFGVSDGPFSGALLENAQPNSIGLAMIRTQPLTKLRG